MAMRSTFAKSFMSARPKKMKMKAAAKMGVKMGMKAKGLKSIFGGKKSKNLPYC